MKPDEAGPAAYVREHRAEIEAALAGVDLAPDLRAGDARRLAHVPDASVHLVVTSPPYPLVGMWDALFERETGVGAEDPRAFDAWHAWLGAAWEEVARVLVPGGIACVNIGDATRTVGGRFRCFANHAEVGRRLEAAGLEPLVPVLWKKPTNKPNAFLGSGFLPTNGYVTLDCEHVLVHRKGGGRKWPAGDVLRYASAFSKEERDRWFTQVWTFAGARQDAEGRRTAAFPRELPDRLVRMFSVVGDTVLDPFAGTGTTLASAREHGRRALGVEQDADLVAAAAARLGGAPDVGDLVDRLARAGGAAVRAP